MSRGHPPPPPTKFGPGKIQAKPATAAFSRLVPPPPVAPFGAASAQRQASAGGLRARAPAHAVATERAARLVPPPVPTPFGAARGQPRLPARNTTALPFVLQRAAVAAVTADPSEFRFLHQTISPEFSQGAAPGSKGDNLDKVVDDIKKGKTNPLHFPALPIFTIDDPDGTYGTETYSLSNRRLYVFRNSGTNSVNVRAATLQEVVGSLWKMSSTSGGMYIPKTTKFGDKEAAVGGLLAKFRSFCEKYSELPTFAVMAVNNYNFRFQ
jgi:hypothetical protein